MSHQADNYKKGILLTLACYLMWGNFPLYWYALRAVGSIQLMSQRIVWSFLFVLMIATLFKSWPTILNTFKNKKICLGLFITSQLLFMNWLTYLWAITENHVIDASLGYFITPILSILLGALFLKERLSRTQTLAVSLSIIGIIWLGIQGGRIPYIAIILAITFGFYGLLKKIIPVKPLAGITIETFFMLPLSCSYLVYEYINHKLVFGALPTASLILLILSGAVTTIPLVLFAEGAKKIPLSLVGIIQFVSPTLQFINGLLFFDETFSVNRFIGFLIVWIAVGIFTVGEYKNYQRQKNLLTQTSNSH